MSGSPLVVRAANDALASPRRIPSSTLQSPRLAPPSSSLVASSSSTPHNHVAAGNGRSSSSSMAMVDLSEQLNNEEKNKYVRGRRLGEGAYAVVYLGHLRTDPSVQVAIKKIKMQQDYTDGLPPDAVREIKHLQELHHPNVISLLSVFSSKDQNLNLVLEFLPLGDLEMLIRDVNGVRYGSADIKAWMAMLIRAVWFCHENFVLHRDIKPNNLLIAADGEVKLADFGLARSFADPHHNMTNQVITRWYRPPELLFGVRHYSGAADIWSVGCVFAELILRAPYLPGETEISQISLICKEFGTPNEETWPGVTSLSRYACVGDPEPTRGPEYFQSRFGVVGYEGVDLLMKSLTPDPRKRITAREMLEHVWWSAEPRPTRKADLPRKMNEDE